MAQNCGDHLDRSEAARVFKAKRAHDRSVHLYDTVGLFNLYFKQIELISGKF